MLKNDERFWVPTATSNAVLKSWGGSDGDFAKLWENSATRWKAISRELTRLGVPLPSGKIVEFGSGMGLLDDLLDDKSASIVMLDHSDAYLRQRSKPLSARCRHVSWSPEGLASLQAEEGSYDWVISLAVFWHVEDATAAALIKELGKLLRPGGYVLIHGFNRATVKKVREMSTRHRLFDDYPTYVIDPDLLRRVLAPDYREVCRETLLLYRKTGAAGSGTRKRFRSLLGRVLDAGERRLRRSLRGSGGDQPR
jgi:2-polyprenyl-3-methyl-5-hydroxy-6-metoxy-1,4-benzoquinol methylase